MPEIDVLRVDHVGIMVENIDAAVAWYVRVLGMTIVDRWAESDAHMAWAHLAIRDFTLELVERPNLGDRRADAGFHHLAITVPDCSVAVDAIDAAGGALVIPPTYFERHDMDWSFVEDPFGNVLEIISYRSQRP